MPKEDQRDGRAEGIKQERRTIGLPEGGAVKARNGMTVYRRLKRPKKKHGASDCKEFNCIYEFGRIWMDALG